MSSFKILVETALIGQGLTDLTDAELLETWTACFPQAPDNVGFAWLWKGQIVIGNLQSFMEYRSQNNLSRIDSYKIKELPESPLSGFCTAGAVLALAQELQAELAVTAGMGGIMAGKISSDLPEICKRQAILIASGFKDMIEAHSSLDYLRERKILVSGIKPVYNGFLFPSEAVVLDRQYAGESLSELTADNCYLLLNSIENNLRLENDSWLPNSIDSGKSAEISGNDFHPAVNKALAHLSKGQSSRLQFTALLKNIVLALKIVEKEEEG